MEDAPSTDAKKISRVASTVVIKIQQDVSLLTCQVEGHDIR
jgi:hypothetical protein